MDSARGNASKENVNNILGNISGDDQYINLNYAPPNLPEQWAMQNKLANNHYMGQFANDNLGYVNPPFNQQLPFNCLQQQLYNANLDNMHNDMHRGFDLYQNLHNTASNVQEMPRFTDYNLFTPHNTYLPNNLQDKQPSPHNYLPANNLQEKQNTSPQLIENLVGNWVPTTTGTYSPFGNISSTFQPKLFENDNNDNLSNRQEKPLIQNEFAERNENFFSRETKKPRIVAEVKPMRPSYSDVLLKAPQNNAKTLGKVDIKDKQVKKDVNKKASKVDKQVKTNNTLNRSNTSNEIKDIPLEKSVNNNKTNEKSGRDTKSGQLNRKWASLDNVNDNFDFKVDLGDRKVKKDENVIKTAKNNQKKLNKTSISNDNADTDSASGKNETLNITKNTVRKINKSGSKPRNYESFGSNERPPGKRATRNRKKESHVPLGFVGQKLKYYTKSWWKMFVRFIFWLYNLIADIFSLSIQLGRDMIFNFWTWFLVHWEQFTDTAVLVVKRVRFLTWIWEKIKREPPKEEQSKSFSHAGLQNNINMPTTGEEAMKRLLACKGKDPYSILGVTPTCTDDDIKRYYKRQAFLVHPDKNQQPGAEEAFKILVHAFDMIGEPERRATYDKSVAESAQVEQAWSELSELLAQLQQKMDAAANTIRCSACGLRHKRIKVDKPCYAARNCSSCKIHHSAREGDIWAEAKCFGFLWHYYACMEGGVYDITEWAGCQKDSLKHLKPDSHHVQYRIALGKQNGPPRRHNNSPRSERPPDLENLLNSLYGQHDNPQNAKRRNKKSSNK